MFEPHEARLLVPLDHFRFNLQWVLALWSLVLYPTIFADLFARPSGHAARLKTANSKKTTPSKASSPPAGGPGRHAGGGRFQDNQQELLNHVATSTGA